MKKLLNSTIIVVSLMTSSLAYAQNAILFKGGYGRGDNSGNKFLSFGLQTTPISKWNCLKLNYEVGVLTISELTEGVSYFGTLAPTLLIKTELGLYASASQGLTIISAKNKYLDNNLQFSTHVSAGLYRNSISLGVFFHHISSAHNSNGNIGMEFIGIESGLEF